MTKAIIIDLKKTIRAIERPEEYLEFFETTDKNMMLPNEITPETQLECINVTRKIYRAIEVSFPIGGGRQKIERYYICIKDWKKMFPLLEGVIKIKTVDLRMRNVELYNELRDLQDNVVLASNGTAIYADRNGTIEIYARNKTDSDNLYLDVVANFVGYPITYNDIDHPDKRNRHSIFLECSYLEN